MKKIDTYIANVTLEIAVDVPVIVSPNVVGEILSTVLKKLPNNMKATLIVVGKK